MANKNIALIGMPGSGKSTVGKLLARILNIPFCDTDELIVQRAGISIPEIFARYGEKHFRALETEALKIAAESSCVIACGGGIITTPESRRVLKEKCTTVYLAAGIDKLCERVGSGEGRPLLSTSARADLERLYAARAKLYEECADFCEDTCEVSPEEVASSIAKKMI